MGIELSYRRISPEKLSELQNDPDAAERFFYGDAALEPEDAVSVYDRDGDVNGWHLSIEKEWQALHYLLTGEVAFDESDADPPARDVVMGGKATQWEATYGYVRRLDPEKVRAVAQALNAVPEATLRARFDARADTEIYAQSATWGEEDWDDLMHVYSCVVRFYSQAASQGEVVLISSN